MTKKRTKVFSDGRQDPVGRSDRGRIIWIAETHRRFGRITRAAVDVLRALIYVFANAHDGRCFPSYERLAEAAGCHTATVGRVLPALERVGLISWVNRLVRVRERVDLGRGVVRWNVRVVRTSNAYDFPQARKTPAIPRKAHDARGTNIEVFPALGAGAESPLMGALARLGKSLGYVK